MFIVNNLSNYTVVEDFPLRVLRTCHYQDLKVLKHDHDFNELVIVQKGSGCHVIENQEIPIGVGNVFVIFPGQVHHYVKFEHLTLLNVLFAPDLLGGFKEDLIHLPGFRLLFQGQPKMDEERYKAGSMLLNEQGLSQVVDIANDILDEQEERPFGMRTSILSSFLKLIICICRDCRPGNNKHSHYAYQVSCAIGYMEKNYLQKINLDSLAVKFGFSVSSFRRFFLETTGLTPIDYLLKLRLKKASTLLDTTNIPVTEIAFKVGFKDNSYFTRQFKKFSGVTPSRYRQTDHGHIDIPKLI